MEDDEKLVGVRLTKDIVGVSRIAWCYVDISGSGSGRA
jgi:hypothetical protein